MSRDVLVPPRVALALGVIACTLVLSGGAFAKKAAPAAACSAQPKEVEEGDPIQLVASSSNFTPGHTLSYVWTTNGGKLQAPNTQNTAIDTTGIAPGSYTATATITDSHRKKNNSATCDAVFAIRAKPNPPRISCSVSPQITQAGAPVAITSMVSSPDGSEITSIQYQASLGRVTGSGTKATVDTAGVSLGSVTVTVSATDARNLMGSGTCAFTVEAAPPPPKVINIASLQFPDRSRPWAVDSKAKATLDNVAARLKADPNARIAIVGYADGESWAAGGKSRQTIDVAAQRAVNAKAYLVQQQGIDPGRIDVLKGSGKSQSANVDWIPQGANVTAASVLQGTTPVNELVVRPYGQ